MGKGITIVMPCLQLIVLSNGDMLVGTVLMMMCKNLINTCKTVYIGENGTIRLITDNMAPTINAQKQIILKQEHKDIATRKNEIS